MNILQLARDQPFLRKDPLKAFRTAVNVQAVRHSQRRVGDAPVDIIAVQRPNEGKDIKKYRAQNERQITREGVEKFISKTTRIVVNGLKFSEPEGKLKEYLETRPFYDTGNRYTFTEYLFGALFPIAIEDPNLISCAFPYNPNRPEVAPNDPVNGFEGGLRPDEELGIEIKLVEPAWMDNECFCFYGGTRKIVTVGGRREEKFFYAADKDNWYTLEPSYEIREGSRRELIYTPVVWYAWDLGTSPVNLLPGAVSTTKFGKYRESFMMPYFNLADEAINAFSDNQAIRVRFAHPVVGITEVPCWNEDCKKGYIFTDNQKTECSVCNGTGTMKSPGPYGTLVKKSASLTSEGSGPGPAMEFYNPDLGIMSASWTTWTELLTLAKQAVGLDLLEGTGVESGKAKDLRLEDLQDLLMTIGVSIGTCGAQLLQQIQALLVPIVGDRKLPSYQLPISFKIHEASELKIEAENALFEDRYQARMDFYRHKYRGQEDMIRLYELAITYAPSILLTEDELTKRVAAGSMTSDDVVRRDNAVLALQRLVAERAIDLLDISEPAAMVAIEAYLVSRGMVTAVNSEAAKEEREKSPLLETVGGTTSIVMISQAVADGAMTEKAGEMLLVEIFGFTPEKAAQLIDIPSNESQEEEVGNTGQGDGDLSE